MPPTTTPFATAPHSLQRDKLQGLSRPPKKRVQPLGVVATVGIVLLCLSAGFRFMHSSAQPKMLKVVASARDLPPGVTVDFGQLRLIDVPPQLVTREMTGSIADVVGRQTRTFIGAGEPIRRAMVFPAMGGVARNIAADERALTLQLNDDALVDHSICPDDRVDVLVVASKDSGRYTKTICQSARVLVAAPKEQIFARGLGASALNKITLAVKPDVAETITEAAEVGKIRLVLRARTSHEDALLAGADENDLLPHSAFRHSAAAIADARQDEPEQVLSAPPPAGAALPLPDVSAAPAPPSDPLEWLVQVFAGNRRETVSVPVK